MIYDRFHAVACGHMDDCAIIDEGASLTYGDLLDRVDALAATLEHDVAVREGDIVLAPVPNSADFVALLLATARLGVILMPVDPALTDRELASYLGRFTVRAAITSAAFQRDRPGAFAGLATDRQHTIDALTAAAPERVSSRPGGPFEGVLAAISTSGSTGAPKVVGRTHRGLLAGFEGLNGVIGVRPGDRVLGVTPFHHAHGLASALILSVMSGGTLVVMRRFLPRRLIECVSEYRVSVIIGSPFIFGTVTECAGDRSAFVTVRAAISSGEAVPAQAARAFFATTGIRILELYGSSEAGIITLDGQPVEGTDIRIVNDHGAAVEPGSAGEVLVRSGWMAAGYLGEDGSWRFALRDGFYPTGDLGHFDTGGRLVLDGRTLRRLNIAGVKVDPVEIERVILERPEVAQVEVSSIIGERGLACIKARLVIRPGQALRRDELIDHCRKALAEHKVPRIVEWVDAIETSLMGKRVTGA